MLVGRVEKARIAAEQFVAAVARQCDGDMLPGQARQRPGRDVSRVGQQRVEVGERGGECLGGQLRRIEDMVFGTVLFGDGARGRAFVEAGFGEAHAEGFQRLRSRLRHVMHDEAAVDTAGEEGAQWHIGDELVLDGLGQKQIGFPD